MKFSNLETLKPAYRQADFENFKPPAFVKPPPAENNRSLSLIE